MAFLIALSLNIGFGKHRVEISVDRVGRNPNQHLQKVHGFVTHSAEAEKADIVSWVEEPFTKFVFALDPFSLQKAGKAQDAPVATNDNEEGRAKNRRVELVKE